MLLRQGKSVGLLGEGDPFFYGSFMHIWRRLDKVSSDRGRAGRNGHVGLLDASQHADHLGQRHPFSVLPGTMGEEQLTRRLADTDAAVIMKVGTHLAKVRRAVTAAGLLERAIYVERGTMQGEQIMPLSEGPDVGGHLISRWC